MASKKLRNLIRASGNTGVAGQSFRNHVTGAGSGARMSEYNLYGWQNWASPNYAHDPGHANVFADNTVLAFTFDLNAGSRFGHIKGGAGNWNLHVPEGGGANESVLQNLVWGAQFPVGNSFEVRVRGMYRYSAGMQIVRNWFRDFGNLEPPPDNLDYAWTIDAAGTAPDLAGYDHFNLQIQYIPPQTDTSAGVFNDYLQITYPVDVAPRAGARVWEVEWHDNSSYTNLIHTGAQLTITSGASNAYGEYWYRYKHSGQGSWTNGSPAPVIHDDPRW